jgi:hypothetical protein
MPPLSTPPYEMDRLSLEDYRLGRALVDELRAQRK